MEEAALGVVRALSDATRDAHGDATCPLIRCFASTRRRRLPNRLVDALDRTHPVDHPDPDDRVLVLLATDGTKPEWCDRRRSQHHQVLPLSGVDLSALPMVTQMFLHFGLPLAALRDDASFTEPSDGSFGVFHVEDAATSAAIPDQAFVRDQQIRSVMGVGGRLPTGEVFATLMFSQSQIDRHQAELLQPVAIGAKLALLPVVERVFADDIVDDASSPLTEEVRSRANLDAMTTLVEFHEARLTDHPGSPDDGFTRRERQLLDHLAAGASNKQIAASIGVTTGTVKWHMHNLFRKLGVTNRAEAAIVAQRRRNAP